jgi:ubiquinone/menaquinone biosynthesis C-methylase UbiE
MAMFDACLRQPMHRPGRIVGPYVEAGATVLDLGCGPGYFSLPMAALVGPAGRIICADIQQTNLDIVRRRAARAALADRVQTVLCQPADIAVRESVDFALAFYMVHEVPDPRSTLTQIAACLRPQGRLLLVEPIFHVPRAAFDGTVRAAEGVGLTVLARPPVRFSRAVLLTHAHGHGQDG